MNRYPHSTSVRIPIAIFLAAACFSAQTTVGQDLEKVQKQVLKDAPKLFSPYHLENKGSVYFIRHDLVFASSLNRAHPFICTEVANAKMQYKGGFLRLEAADQARGVVAKGVLQFVVAGRSRQRLGKVRLEIADSPKGVSFGRTDKCDVKEMMDVRGESWADSGQSQIALEVEFEATKLFEESPLMVRYAAPQLVGKLPGHKELPQFHRVQNVEPFKRRALPQGAFRLGILKEDLLKWPPLQKDAKKDE